MPTNDFGTPINVQIRTADAQTALKALITAVQSTEAQIQDFGKRTDAAMAGVQASLTRLEQKAVSTGAGIGHAFNSINFSTLETSLIGLQTRFESQIHNAMIHVSKRYLHLMQTFCSRVAHVWQSGQRL